MIFAKKCRVPSPVKFPALDLQIQIQNRVEVFAKVHSMHFPSHFQIMKHVRKLEDRRNTSQVFIFTRKNWRLRRHFCSLRLPSYKSCGLNYTYLQKAENNLILKPENQGDGDGLKAPLRYFSRVQEKVSNVLFYFV